MAHGPSTEWGEDKASSYKTRLGLIMFFIYAVVYIGFIVINLANPKGMETVVLAGLNLAIVYGVGLIVFAILLGLLYNFLCTKKENELNVDKDKGGN